MGTMVVPAKLDKLDSVLEYVQNELAAYDCSTDSLTKIDVIVEEIFVNIARYAYPDGEGVAEISCEVDEDDAILFLQFCDKGIPFNPLAKDDPDTSLTIDKRPVGGLGIFMVKKFADEIKYEYSEGQNILLIQKKLR